MATAAEVLLLVKARDDASKVLSGISKNANAMGNSLKSAGKMAAIGLAGGIGIAAIGIKAFVGEAEEARKIMSQTEAVLKSTAGAAGLNGREIAKMAQEFSNATNYTDDAVQSAQNVLLTFTKVSKEAFKPATGAILDMATALGTDLQAATILVGKALNDPIKGITALTRSGVQFTESQKEQIKVAVEAGDTFKAQTIILKELETQFGGSAAAAADPMTQLSNAFGELKEQLGTLLLPVAMLFARVLKDDIVPMIQTGTEAIGNFATVIRAGLAGDITATADAFNLLPEPLQVLATWLNDNRPQIEDLIDKAKELADTIRTLSEEVITGWIIILVALWPKLVEMAKWLEENRKVAAALAAVIIALAVILGSTAAAIVAIAAVIGWLTQRINESIEAGGYWAGVFERVGNILAVVTTILSGATDAMNWLNDAVTRAGEATNTRLVAALVVLQPTLDTATRFANYLRDAFFRLRDAAYAVRDAIKSIPIPKLPSLPGFGFAAGGTVPYTGLHLVGERGPELAMLPGGTRVFNNRESQQIAASGAGGAGVQNFYIDRVEIHGDPAAGLSALGASV